MGVKGRERLYQRSSPLGARVDDAVAARRAERQRRGGLAVVPPAAEGPAEGPEWRQGAIEPGPGTAARFGRPVTGAARLAPTAAHPEPRRVPASRPHLAGGAEVETGIAFDLAARQAQALATSVRPDPAPLSGGAPRAVADIDETAGASANAAAGRAMGAVTPGQLRYRLTVRGQKFLVALGFALAIGVGAIVGSVFDGAGEPAETTTMVVQSGDSLWSIAQGMSTPGEDLRPVMDQISSLNGLSTAMIDTGQTLVLPAQ